MIPLLEALIYNWLEAEVQGHGRAFWMYFLGQSTYKSLHKIQIVPPSFKYLLRVRERLKKDFQWVGSIRDGVIFFRYQVLAVFVSVFNGWDCIRDWVLLNSSIQVGLGTYHFLEENLQN